MKKPVLLKVAMAFLILQLAFQTGIWAMAMVYIPDLNRSTPLICDVSNFECGFLSAVVRSLKLGDKTIIMPIKDYSYAMGKISANFLIPALIGVGALVTIRKRMYKTYLVSSVVLAVVLLAERSAPVLMLPVLICSVFPAVKRYFKATAVMPPAANE